MKYPGDLVYFLKFVGADVLAVAGAVLLVVFITARYFLKQRRKKTSGQP